MLLNLIMSFSSKGKEEIVLFLLNELILGLIVWLVGLSITFVFKGIVLTSGYEIIPYYYTFIYSTAINPKPKPHKYHKLICCLFLSLSLSAISPGCTPRWGRPVPGPVQLPASQRGRAGAEGGRHCGCDGEV